MISRRQMVAATLAAVLARTARAATYPDRPIKLIVPFTPGGPVDVMARLVGQYLSAKLGQPVVVENRPGAGGTIASKLVAGAEPDGYTLLFASAGSLAISPSLYKNLGYDPVAGFTPVALVANHPQAMVVHPSVPVHSVKELIAYAKINPGKLNYGAAPGTPPHLMGELFRTLAGIDIVFVPYKGAAPALTDLLAGRTQMTMLSTAVIVPPILAGNLRALAVTSTARWHELPDVPTMTEAGFAGFPQGSWTAVVAPAGTPAGVVAKLNTTINDGLRSSALHDSFVRLGAEIKIDTPQQLGGLLAEETRKWAEVIKSAGVAVN
ncbi:MAG TPA: tripartite tricarboxylate transporter substrate binding protein [Xanthobacteraceae bacterium]|jgi:tripartite-type tricarboxylate transporter receptor subunit TctC